MMITDDEIVWGCVFGLMIVGLCVFIICMIVAAFDPVVGEEVVFKVDVPGIAMKGTVIEIKTTRSGQRKLYRISYVGRDGKVYRNTFLRKDFAYQGE